MTVLAVTQVISSSANFSMAAPAAGPTQFVSVRLSNYTPFAYTCSNLGDDPGSTISLLPYTQNYYSFSGLRGPINFVAQGPIPITIPPTMYVIGEFCTNANDLSGSYPISLGGQVEAQIPAGATVIISGGQVNIETAPGTAVSATLPQIDLGTYVLTATVGSFGTQLISVPDSVNAILVEFNSTPAPVGLRVDIFDGNATADPLIYQEWPYANAGITSGPNNTSQWVVPVSPANANTANQILLRYTLTGPVGGPTQLFRVNITGFQSTVPPSSPPEAVALAAAVHLSPANTFTLLPQDPTGRFFEISTISSDNSFQAWINNTMSDVIYQCGSTGYAISFPVPIVCSRLDVGSSPGGNISVTYRYH